MNAQLKAAQHPMSDGSIREDYRKKLTDLFAREAQELPGIDWHVARAVVNKRPYFDIDLKTNSVALEEWMRPAFANILAETRSRLDDISIHHMEVEGFRSWRSPLPGPSLYWPARVRLRFHFNAEREAAELPAAPEPKRSLVDVLLHRPKPVPYVPPKKFVMTVE